MAMDLNTQPIAGRHIPFDRRTDVMTGYPDSEDRSLNRRKRFTGVETQLGIKRQ